LANSPASLEHVVASSGALVRLLVEPREELERIENTTYGATKNNPMRRDFNKQEKDVYQQICSSLDQAWNMVKTKTNDDASPPQGENKVPPTMLSGTTVQYLQKIEYRLGIFFRKMKPSSVHVPSSRRHFHAAVMGTLPLKNQNVSDKARFWLATLHSDGQDENTTLDTSAVSLNIDRCPEEYIISLYSSFASRFDELLVTKLSYQTPTILRRLVDGVVKNAPSSQPWAMRAADLGCGTGLSGLAFRPCVKEYIVGVDLSPEMIERARERGCYDELVVGDVECVFKDDSSESSSHNTFDLVLACDVFVYIGDLHSIFHSVAKALTPRKGIFCFSTEYLANDDPRLGNNKASSDRGYILHSCARFAHKQSYVEGLAKEFHFNILALKICPIRKNEGKDVIGMLVVLQKQSTK
jgi:predicted TPR repeat methyltransferase